MISKQKVALITGHSGAIGEAIARKLKKRGYFTIGIAKKGKQNVVDKQYLHDLSFHGDEFIGMLRSELMEFGQLTVFVHAAGTSLVVPFQDITREEYYRCLEINLNSAVFLSQMVYRILRDTGRGGSIIFISSQVALPDGAQAYNTVYSVSKSGLNGLIRALAKEGSPRIRVNGICPGDVKSDLAKRGADKFCEIMDINYEQYEEMIVNRSAIKRWILPEEIAEATMFLIENQVMTGTLLNLSGGSVIS